MTSKPESSAPVSPASRSARIVGGTIGVLFCLGVSVGFAKAVSEHDAWSTTDVLVMTAIVLAAAGFIWLALSGLQGASRINGRIGKSTLMSQRLLWIAGGLGAVLGIVFAIGGWSQTGDLHSNPVFSNSALHPVAVALLLLGVVITNVLSYKWHKAADEHENAAAYFGGILSLYAYITATVSWWLLWRGGFTGEPEWMVIFLGVLTLWGVAWLWKRSH